MRIFPRRTSLFGLVQLIVSLCGAASCAPASVASAPSPGAGACGHPGHPGATPPGPIHHVVLVTLDGMLPDVYLHPDVHGLKVPTLRALVARGAASSGALSVFPSVTYPSHTSMTTGVVPGKHGIVSNRTFDPFENDLDGWRWYAEDIRRDPVWRVAERAGYGAALVHWPVSAGARTTWLVPEYWRAKNDNDRKLLRAMSTPGLLETVAQEHADFWPRYAPPNVRDDALMDIATHLLTAEQPALLLLHLVEVDGAQHHFGVWSPEAITAIEGDDAQLARLFATLEKTGLARDTNVIVASDHGFMNAPAMVKPGVLLREAGLAKVNAEGHVTEWKAAVLSSSGQAYVYLNDPADKATGAAVRALFTEKARDASSGIGRVYETQEIVAKGGDASAFLALEPVPGFQFGAGFAGDYVAPPVYRGTHGYDPERPEMHASLILAGATVPHGTLEDARLVDIGPTIASWLGLALPDADGRALRVVASH
jgi:predicted AlkP superfamily pyrophosphatase or phosphodiesterase